MRSTWYEFSSEPAVFLYTFAACTYTAVMQNFILQKACSPYEEPALDYECNDTDLIQAAMELMTVRNTLIEVLPALALFLAGCGRDATGLNKPMMYVSLIGQVLGVSIEVFAAWMWTVSVWKTCISDALIHCISGGNKLFYLGAACVVTDHSKPEDRTTRLTLNLSAAIAGACLATGLSDHYFKYIGYKASFILVIFLLLVTLALTAFIFEDRGNLIKNGSWHISEKLRTIFKSRPNNKVIWLMIISSVLINTSTKAEGNLFLYYLHEGFGFTVTQAGFYATYQLIIGVASSMALPRLLSTFLKRSDFNIGIVSAIVAVVSSIAMVFVKSRPELLTIALLSFTKCFLFTIPISVVTRCVNNYEIGIYVSLCYIGDCILPTGFFYIYDSIFNATLKSMPGAFYLISAGVGILLIIFYRIANSIYVSPENELEETCETTDTDIEKCGNCHEKKVKF